MSCGVMCTLAAKTIWSSGWLGARIFRLQTNQMKRAFDEGVAQSDQLPYTT